MSLKIISIRKKNMACSFLLAVFSMALPAQINAQNLEQQKTVAAKPSVKKTFYGQASFYSNKFNGRLTSSGEIFSQAKMTCACNGLPMGTWVKVTNLRNNKSAIVKVNDRLHPSMKRLVDLTRAAAKKLGFTEAGLTRVRVEVLGRKKPAE